MAQIDFSKLNERMSQQGAAPAGNNDGRPRVGFFTLKNDGDEAIVRFMHDSPADFDIVAVHPVVVDGKNRKVNCIRDPQEPVDNCPFCAAGKSLQYRFYIHLIEYRPGEDGHMQAIPRVWERPTAFATMLNNYIQDLGPLSNILCKVRRNGAAGSTNTTYTITPNLNPNVYNPEMYPKHPELFEGYKAVGNAVLDRNYNELAQMVGSASAPAASAPTYSRAPQQNAAPAYSAPQAAPAQPAYQPTQPAYSMPTQQPARTYVPNAPAGQDTAAPARPRRFYQ